MEVTSKQEHGCIPIRITKFGSYHWSSKYHGSSKYGKNLYILTIEA